jgi:hypothetical protein
MKLGNYFLFVVVAVLVLADPHENRTIAPLAEGLTGVNSNREGSIPYNIKTLAAPTLYPSRMPSLASPEESLQPTSQASSFLADSVAHTCGAKDPVSGAVRPLRIMTSSTDEYFPVFMNWLVYFHEVCPSVANIYFICLDTVIEKKLISYGLTCAHVYHFSGAHADIWLVRTRLTHSLLAQGFDVLLTDADALWLRNPFPLIEAHLDADIVSSRGLFPENVSKVLGAALCMGFIYVKASAHTVTLWGEVAAHMARQTTPDDQRDINNLLLSLGLHYPSKPTYIVSTEYSKGYFQHHNHNYKVVLLPHVLFRRICDQERMSDIHSAVVAHCLSHQKKGASKINTAEALGLWQLRKDWQSITLHGDLQAYLDAISVTDSRRMKISTARAAEEGGGIARRAVRSLSEGIWSMGAYMRGTVSTTSSLVPTGVAHGSQAESTPTEGRRSDLTAVSVPVCLEYSSNRHLFHISGNRSAHNCWYVSSTAPEEVVRQFEEVVSSGD